jgi:hypothetical protein
MRYTIPHIPTRRRGSTAVMAMLFLMVLSTLAIAMFSSATMNVQSSGNLAHVERARALAESGLRWQAYRFVRMPRPKTLAGRIDATVAADLWPDLKDAIRTDYDGLVAPAERGADDYGTWIESKPIAIDGGDDRFVITVEQPFVDPADPLGEVKMRVTSTATAHGATRSVSMLFGITKKVRFAVVGKVPIQLGRNTIVEGPVGMATPNKYPPILMLSDFMHFHTGLRDRVTGWNNFLKGNSTVNGVSVKNHNGYDNRVSVNHPLEMDLAARAGYRDVNGDAYVDEYDLFLDTFDADRDGGVSRQEFTKPFSSELYDDNLFNAIDSLGAPSFAGDVQREGYQDGRIDNSDGYAKVRGQIALAATANEWQSNLAGQGKTINDMIQGGVAPDDPTEAPVKFGADASDIFDLAPENFEQAALNFAAKTGSAAGTTKRTQGRIENTTLTAADVAYSPPHVKITAAGGTSFAVNQVVTTDAFNAANAAAQAAGKTKATSTTAPTTADEKTPLGSTTHQATYRRPVFRKMHFKNVKIPKGTNALFEDCTFEGVTFVEMERNITKSNGTVTTNKDDGMTWSKKMNSGYTFSANTALTATTSQGFSKGNNIRFNNCTFEGPLAGNYATAYTHFTNSWEFTGATRFDNKVDQTATLVAPQANIEMGSFTRPDQAPSTLVGVVVAGNIDIRGTSTVDGSIIITGDGAGNTTLAYFGASDSDTDAGANPEGGFGRLNIRYNPYRALPDGINIAVDVLPDVTTYKEGYEYAM